MKCFNGQRIIKALLCGLLLSLAAGCSESPEQAYYRMVAAAKMGHKEAFLEGFTPDSRKLIEALLELSELYSLRQRDPYRLLVHTDVIETERAEPERVPGQQELREVALLTVQVGRSRRKIKMVKFDRSWKIDAFELESFWEDRSNFRF